MENAKFLHERCELYIQTQLSGETFDSFYAKLATLAGICSLSYQATVSAEQSLPDEMLRDRVGMGAFDDTMRKSSSQRVTLLLQS